MKKKLTIHCLILFLENPDVYASKDTFLPSGYGFPLMKGSYLLNYVNKWQGSFELNSLRDK